MKLNLIISILLLLGGSFKATADQKTKISVNFFLEETEIKPDYARNSSNLNQIIDLLHAVENNNNSRLISVTFGGKTSLDGSYETNYRIAIERRDALEKFVRSRVDIPESIIHRDDSYIDWHWLAGEISASDIPDRDKIASIIYDGGLLEEYYAEYHRDSRIASLRWMDNESVWKQLEKRYFDFMRSASIEIVVENSVPTTSPIPPAEPTNSTSSSAPASDTSSDATDTPASLTPFNHHAYIKTNILGWGMGMVNAAIEFDAAPHWSVALPIYYSGWNYFSNDLKFRIFDVKPEVRYWLKPDNKGFFVGAHGGVAWYNFAFKGDFRYQTHSNNHPAAGGGISLGYRLDFQKHWGVEFAVGAGVYDTEYDKVFNTKDGRLVETARKTYIGLDMTSIALVYRFNIGK